MIFGCLDRPQMIDSLLSLHVLGQDAELKMCVGACVCLCEWVNVACVVKVLSEKTIEI